MKLQNAQFYTNKPDQKTYEQAQIQRHAVKSYKKRTAEEYKICAEHICDMINSDAKMLCLGTRNNHERDVFKEALNIAVSSQDIAEASNADYIGDFNKLSDIVPHDWDVIYSNSMDHAVDAEAALFEWLKVLKPGGIMILGFSFDQAVGPSDCNSFSDSRVDAFMKSASEFKYVKSFKAVDYKYWIITKV